MSSSPGREGAAAPGVDPPHQEAGGPRPPPTELGTFRHGARKVLRHVRWARSEGLGRLVEEDRLDPRERVVTAWRKARWRRREGGPPGGARPLYVVGLQRSGTNMLLRGIDAAPEVEVRGENDRAVFHRYRLRSEEALVTAVAASRHRVVVVKPLCDSQRVGDLLDLPGLPDGRAVWVYRDVDARARSELAKFGASNLSALRAISAGAGEGTWQAERLPRQTVELVRSFDTTTMSPATGAVLFWVVRNMLFFDLGLDVRADVTLLCYDDFVAAPDEEMERLCAYVGLSARPEFTAHVVARRSHGSAPLDVDPRARRLAEQVGDRLREARVGSATGGTA